MSYSYPSKRFPLYNSDNNSYKNSAEKEKISYLKNYFKGLSKKEAMEALLFSDIKNYISEETLKELSESI